MKARNTTLKLKSSWMTGFKPSGRRISKRLIVFARSYAKKGLRRSYADPQLPAALVREDAIEHVTPELNWKRGRQLRPEEAQEVDALQKRRLAGALRRRTEKPGAQPRPRDQRVARRLALEDQVLQRRLPRACTHVLAGLLLEAHARGALDALRQSQLQLVLAHDGVDGSGLHDSAGLRGAATPATTARGSANFFTSYFKCA